MLVPTKGPPIFPAIVTGIFRCRDVGTGVVVPNTYYHFGRYHLYCRGKRDRGGTDVTSSEEGRRITQQQVSRQQHSMHQSVWA